MLRIFQSGPRRICGRDERDIRGRENEYIHDLIWLVNFVESQQKCEGSEPAHDGKARAFRLEWCIGRALSLQEMSIIRAKNKETNLAIGVPEPHHVSPGRVIVVDNTGSRNAAVLSRTASVASASRPRWGLTHGSGQQ